MSRPMKRTPEGDEICRAEAHRRAQRMSNKQLARLTGLTPKYVAQIVARFRREYERVDVSHETSTLEPTSSLR